jgi:hypothetical protein
MCVCYNMAGFRTQRHQYQEIPQTFEEILHIQPKRVSEVYLKHVSNIAPNCCNYFQVLEDIIDLSDILRYSFSTICGGAIQ